MIDHRRSSLNLGPNVWKYFTPTETTMQMATHRVDNLEPVCWDCHRVIHERSAPLAMMRSATML